MTLHFSRWNRGHLRTSLDTHQGHARRPAVPRMLVNTRAAVHTRRHSCTLRHLCTLTRAHSLMHTQTLVHSQTLVHTHSCTLADNRAHTLTHVHSAGYSIQWAWLWICLAKHWEITCISVNEGCCGHPALSHCSRPPLGVSPRGSGWRRAGPPTSPEWSGCRSKE